MNNEPEQILEGKTRVRVVWETREGPVTLDGVIKYGERSGYVVMFDSPHPFSAGGPPRDGIWVGDSNSARIIAWLGEEPPRQ